MTLRHKRHFMTIGAFVTSYALATGVHGAVRYVDSGATGANDGSSWANAYTSLATAIGGASGGDELWIKAGTYEPTTGSDRTISFLVDKSLTLRGGFDGTETSASQRDILANPTTLTGDLSSNDTANFGNRGDNSYHVVKFVPEEGDSLLLNGLIIKAGNADSTSGTNGYGGGVFVDDEAEDGDIRLTMTICHVLDNSALRAGGGVAGYLAGVELRGDPDDLSEEANTFISGNRCLDNHAGVVDGGGGVNVGYLRATRCTFSDNLGVDTIGGALALVLSAVGEPSSLVNVRFLDNVADDVGGAVAMYSSADFTNCLFARNETTGEAPSSVGTGGAIYTKAAATLINCTVAENMAANEGGNGGGLAGGMGGNPFIRNSVFWGNRVDTGSGLEDDHSAQLTVHPTGTLASSPLAYSDIENYEGCIFGCPFPLPNYYNIGDDLDDHDPLFADPASDNYRHLSFHLWDVADDASLPDDVNDVDEDSNTAETLPIDLVLANRIIASHVDMGAYEWCLGDLNGDGTVDGADNGLLLAAWGACSGPCLGDLNGDGDVDGADLGLLGANWGGCAGESLMGGSPLEQLAEQYAFESVDEFCTWLGELSAEERYEVLSPIL